MLFLVLALFFALLVVPLWALAVHFWEQDHPQPDPDEDDDQGAWSDFL